MSRMFVFTDSRTNLNSIIDGLDYPFFDLDVCIFLLSFSPQAGIQRNKGNHLVFIQQDGSSLPVTLRLAPGIQSLNQRLTAPPRRHPRTHRQHQSQSPSPRSRRSSALLRRHSRACSGIQRNERYCLYFSVSSRHRISSCLFCLYSEKLTTTNGRIDRWQYLNVQQKELKML